MLVINVIKLDYKMIQLPYADVHGYGTQRLFDDVSSDCKHITRW